jgi:hypothetical protein
MQVVSSFYALIDISCDILLKLCAMVVMSPVCAVPGLLLGVGAVCLGKVYMKAQLAVKREMSNAKAPVIGHVNSTITGLGKSTMRASAHFQSAELTWFCSVYSSVWGAGCLPTRGIPPDRPLYLSCQDLPKPEQVCL